MTSDKRKAYLKRYSPFFLVLGALIYFEFFKKK